MLNHLIEKHFNAHIKNIFKNNYEVRKYLLEHPRKHICINHLVDEIRTCELSNRIIKPDDLPGIIKDFTIMFSKAAIQHQEENIMSDNKKTLKIKKYEKEKYIIDSVANAEEANMEDT